jgi:hypothetical protein
VLGLQNEGKYSFMDCAFGGGGGGMPVVEPGRRSVERLKASRVKYGSFQCHAGNARPG